MIVVYKPYMVKQFKAAIYKAGQLNRSIEEIVLSQDESDQLAYETQGHCNPPETHWGTCEFEGIKIRVRS